jgi:seryl-tRNA synthetase
MLDLALVRAEPARVKAALARRGAWAEAVDAAVDLDRRWCARQDVRETLRTRRRRISDEVARRTPDRASDEDAESEAPDLVRAGRRAARDLKAVERAMRDLAARREAALLALPNLPGTDVPDAPPDLDAAGPAWPHPFPPLPHWDLVEMLRLAVPADGAGSGFLLWRGAGARLVRGLVRLMLDVHAAEGRREEVLAPPLAARRALTASAHLPALEGMLLEVGEASRDAPSREREHEEERGGSEPVPSEAEEYPPRDTQNKRGRCGDRPRPADSDAGDADLFLAPRAEPHLATLYADTVLDAGRLPARLVAAATALRRAPHGGGAEGRGLLRLAAFPTVEVYTLCRPEASDEELERAVAAAETILERLGVAHRRRIRAATDLSHAAARTVSLDVWCPGLPPSGRWVEVAALSSFTDYQARRAGMAYRAEDGRTRLVHTVGGAAVAVPRLLAALLEAGQQADGSVRLPAAL